MEVEEGGVGEHRGPDRRSSGERRTGIGRRVWDRRLYDSLFRQRTAYARRTGSVRRKQSPEAASDGQPSNGDDTR